MMSTERIHSAKVVEIISKLELAKKLLK